MSGPSTRSKSSRHYDFAVAAGSESDFDPPEKKLVSPSERRCQRSVRSFQHGPCCVAVRRQRVQRRELELTQQ